MNNREILETALRQSAIDSGCRPEDFLKDENTVVLSGVHPEARKYLQLPFECDLTCYGHGIVASVSEEMREAVTEYIGKYSAPHCFETPHLHVLEESLEKQGLKMCFMAEYFLPDMESLKPLFCPYPMRLMTPEDFQTCYTSQWSNALCEKRRHLDRLALGAFDGETLVGMAGCSADCGEMWQIGIDVLPAYRRQGIASALTSNLALEIIRRGKVPFYCAAWSNIASVRNAVKSGFRPAWVQVTAKKKEFVDEMNR